MAIVDKLTAIADGFRSSRGTSKEYSLDEMAVLAAEKLSGGDSGGSGASGLTCEVQIASDVSNPVVTAVNLAARVSVSSIVFEGYQLQYIQSTGSQYFDTGVVPDANTEIEMKYSVQNILTYGNHMLSAASFYLPFPRAYTGVYSFLANRMGTELTINLTPSTNTIYTIKAFPSNKIIINDTEYGTLTAGSSSPTGTLYMNTYGGSPGHSYYTGSAKIYYCKIWKNGVLVRDFVPYFSATTEVGMMDLVESKLYTSIGSGQFIAGPAVV